MANPIQESVREIPSAVEANTKSFRRIALHTNQSSSEHYGTSVLSENSANPDQTFRAKPRMPSSPPRRIVNDDAKLPVLRNRNLGVKIEVQT